MSNDVAVAGNINKLQYCALMLMICNKCGYKVGTFSHFIQNFHIYDRHIEQVNTIIERLNELEKEECVQPLLQLNTNKDFFQITLEDFEVLNYQPNENKLKFELAI